MKSATELRNIDHRNTRLTNQRLQTLREEEQNSTTTMVEGKMKQQKKQIKKKHKSKHKKMNN